MLATVALVVAALAVARAGPPTSRDNSVQQLFDSLAEQEKEYFLRLQLAKALATNRSPRTSKDTALEALLDIPDPTKHKLKDLSSKLPEGFSSKLYDDVTSRYNLSHRAVKRLVKAGRFCNGNGVCLSVEDIGSNCCYFAKGYDLRGLD